MSKLNRFFASCLLIAAMSTVSLAEGGDTQGPSNPAPPPPPPQGQTFQNELNYTETESSGSLDALETAEAIGLWLLSEIF
ncbi:MAG TPA: hypothetical protein VJT71_20930 [Pyrinomonadaceae bacterium]|nr:hypothetical protein [Pyrinomonadaceae bacterium]